MKKTRVLITVTIALSLVCISLIRYILYERFTKSAPNTLCLPAFLVSDFTWHASNISQDGQIRQPFFLSTFAQDHWGEDEFAILDAAISSFILFEEGLILPWVDEYAPLLFSWYLPWQWYNNHIWIVKSPFDMTFELQASMEVQWIDENSNPMLIYIRAETIQFMYSEKYGAFAITHVGNIPRSNIAGARQLFHMDVDAFFSLLQIIEYMYDIPCYHLHYDDGIAQQLHISSQL